MVTTTSEVILMSTQNQCLRHKLRNNKLNLKYVIIFKKQNMPKDARFDILLLLTSKVIKLVTNHFFSKIAARSYTLRNMP